MFSLFMGLWSYLFSKAELHLLIVGLDDAGKTVGTCYWEGGRSIGRLVDGPLTLGSFPSK